MTKMRMLLSSLFAAGAVLLGTAAPAQAMTIDPGGQVYVPSALPHCPAGFGVRWCWRYSGENNVWYFRWFDGRGYTHKGAYAWPSQLPAWV